MRQVSRPHASEGCRMKLASNRATRQQVAKQERTLAELGAVLDSQAQAIAGLARNQDVLRNVMVSFGENDRKLRQSFWARLRWLARGA